MTHTCMISYYHDTADPFSLSLLVITAKTVSVGAVEPNYIALSLACTLAIAKQNTASTT